MRILPGLILLSSPAIAARATNSQKVPKNAVLLSKVSSLTLRAGKSTASRRVSPVPQLQCVGPADVCKLYAIDTMRCTNDGADYDAENVQWSCRASLPEEFKLGSTEVGCEGYESSDDPYVLKGSCGVEYRLLLTDQGEEKYKLNERPQSWQSYFDHSEYSPLSGRSSGARNGGEKWAGYVFMAIFAAVAFIILRAFFRAWRGDNAQPGGRPGWNGGGGDDSDPPPPYDYQPPRQKTATSLPRSATTSTRSSDRNQTQDGWRPGVWTGAAAGAAAGYMAGRSTRAQQPPSQPQVQQRTGSSWLFGGGRSRRSDAPSNPIVRGAPSASPSSSSPSYSSSRHESTGFGSTNRR